MKTKRIDFKTFPSVAEAVSYYYEKGFITFQEEEEDRHYRIMRRGCEEVMITHKNLLEVESSHVEISE